MKGILSVLLLLLGGSFYGQTNYQFYMNLNEVEDDRLKVTLLAPAIEQEKIVYNMPKIVPGTYHIYDFGQYVTNFEALDKEGKKLAVTKLDDNRWEIETSKKLHKINYWVEDTWDAEVEDFVFEPAGTNIQKDSSFMINTHGFFGYFDGMKNHGFELNITRPANFYGSTGLSDVTTTDNTDKYQIKNYMALVDAPIMYNEPDTTFIKVGETDVLISVYSKNKSASAVEIAKDIQEVLEAQRKYLGGTLPVKKYAFIIHLYDGMSKSGASGALEHSYSSVYFLPEMSAERLSGFIIRIAAHEFFHIVTPLNIHSEQIGNFDYINPEMSQHLWLYEGVTEYFAGHVQVYEGLMTSIDYLALIEEKLEGADEFKDDLPFTEMSLGCLDKYEDQYSNVYSKGPLIAMCLDILLREYSEGKEGVKDLMSKLSNEYGKDESFKDDELFDKIAELSYPEIRSFFKDYVEGELPLPIQSVLEKVGVIYEENAKMEGFSLGGMELGFNPETGRLFVVSTRSMDAFGRDLGYKKGDELFSINGTELSIENLEQVLEDFHSNIQEGDLVEIEVVRKKKDKEKKKKLKGKAISIEFQVKHFIEFNKNATERQIQLRKAWLNEDRKE